MIRGWNSAGWYVQPRRVGDRIAKLMAGPGTVVMGDTLSIKVYQALSAALELNPTRKAVLSDSGNFPVRSLYRRGASQIARPRLRVEGCGARGGGGGDR